ncbi:MAG TPA: hypothetical protein VFB21_14615, partial [Chthonomonadaceae bacterium]|nr:hypothetical protein [Chthonomonadaceae bacterium]
MAAGPGTPLRSRGMAAARFAGRLASRHAVRTVRRDSGQIGLASLRFARSIQAHVGHEQPASRTGLWLRRWRWSAGGAFARWRQVALRIAGQMRFVTARAFRRPPAFSDALSPQEALSLTWPASASGASREGRRGTVGRAAEESRRAAHPTLLTGTAQRQNLSLAPEAGRTAGSLSARLHRAQERPDGGPSAGRSWPSSAIARGSTGLPSGTSVRPGTSARAERISAPLAARAVLWAREQTVAGRAGQTFAHRLRGGPGQAVLGAPVQKRPGVLSGTGMVGSRALLTGRGGTSIGSALPIRIAQARAAAGQGRARRSVESYPALRRLPRLEEWLLSGAGSVFGGGQLPDERARFLLSEPEEGQATPTQEATGRPALFFGRMPFSAAWLAGGYPPGSLGGPGSAGRPRFERELPPAGSAGAHRRDTQAVVRERGAVAGVSFPALLSRQGRMLAALLASQGQPFPRQDGDASISMEARSPATMSETGAQRGIPAGGMGRYAPFLLARQGAAPARRARPLPAGAQAVRSARRPEMPGEDTGFPASAVGFRQAGVSALLRALSGRWQERPASITRDDGSAPLAGSRQAASRRSAPEEDASLRSARQERAMSARLSGKEREGAADDALALSSAERRTAFPGKAWTPRQPTGRSADRRTQERAGIRRAPERISAPFRPSSAAAPVQEAASFAERLSRSSGEEAQAYARMSPARLRARLIAR